METHMGQENTHPESSPGPSSISRALGRVFSCPAGEMF